MKAKTRERAAALAALVLLTAMAAPAFGRWSEEKQAEMDAACEVAREARLAPMRAEFVEECVEKKQKEDRAACERFYADYGARSGNRAPLFYDLPECEEAFNYRRGRH